MAESTNPQPATNEEFPPLQDDPTMPAPEEPATTVAAGEAAVAAEPAAPKEDPWAEPEPVIPPSPEPRNPALALIGLVVVVAVTAIIVLLIYAHNLQVKLDQLASPPAATKPPEFLLVSAVYGSGTHFVDVTDRVAEMLRQPGAEFAAKPDWLRRDPTPGWNKELVIIYNVQGQRHIFMTGEGGHVSQAILTEEAKK